MLAINGTNFSEFDSSDPIAKQVKGAITKIKKKRYWKLIFHDSKLQPVKPGAGKLRESSAGVSMRTQGKYVFEGMEYEITYFRTTLGEGRDRKFQPRRYPFLGTQILDSKKEADLIFYLMCVVPYADYCEELKNYQNPSRTGSVPYYKVEDLVGDARKVSETDRLTTKVSMYIYDDDFGADDSKLRDIASAYGIVQAQELDIDLLRLRLKDTLLKQKDGKYDEEMLRDFISDIKDDASVTLKAKVQLAIEHKLAVTKANKNNRKSWYYGVEGKPVDYICAVPIGSDAQTALLAFLLKKKEKQEEFVQFVDTKLTEMAETKNPDGENE